MSAMLKGITKSHFPNLVLHLSSVFSYRRKAMFLQRVPCHVPCRSKHFLRDIIIPFPILLIKRQKFKAVNQPVQGHWVKLIEHKPKLESMSGNYYLPFCS